MARPRKNQFTAITPFPASKKMGFINTLQAKNTELEREVVRLRKALGDLVVDQYLQTKGY